MTLKKRFIIHSVLLAFAPVAGQAGAAQPAASVTALPDYQAAKKKVLSAAPGSAEQLAALERFLSATSELPQDQREVERIDLYSDFLNRIRPANLADVLEKFLNFMDDVTPQYANGLTSSVFNMSMGNSQLRSKAAEKLLALIDQDQTFGRDLYYLSSIANCNECRPGLRYRAIDGWRKKIESVTPEESLNAILASFNDESKEQPSVMDRLGAAHLLKIAEQISRRTAKRAAYYYAARNGAEEVSKKAQPLLFAIVDAMDQDDKYDLYAYYANASLAGSAFEKAAFRKWEESLGGLAQAVKVDRLRMLAKDLSPETGLKPGLHSRAAELLAEEQKRSPAPVQP